MRLTSFLIVIDGFSHLFVTSRFWTQRSSRRFFFSQIPRFLRRKGSVWQIWVANQVTGTVLGQEWSSTFHRRYFLWQKTRSRCILVYYGFDARKAMIFGGISNILDSSLGQRRLSWCNGSGEFEFGEHTRKEFFVWADA